ncbi:hypothetical protein [Algoriphagus marincola]|uniref:hypothetical protein n=1 Tax=Algoriphagus marincola TaxID=264027 RepID=UPI0004205A9B|nr:hypothetical protein [Algoriphagus marincola]
MPKKKKGKHSPPDFENIVDFSEKMGLFPEDIPFGTNVGCGGKSPNKDTQKPKNQ